MIRLMIGNYINFDMTSFYESNFVVHISGYLAPCAAVFITRLSDTRVTVLFDVNQNRYCKPIAEIASIFDNIPPYSDSRAIVA